MNIRIGTRGSKLALWQAYYTQKLLQQAGASTEIITIETKGDKILDKALSKIGSKGVFTEELEAQLREKNIDIAVHSAKDVQSDLPEDLPLVAFTEREVVNDVLVSFDKNASLKNENLIVGTSSTRRVALLKHFYPHIKTVDMRGNLQTRLRKLQEGQCDALILAYAGVHRMDYDEHIAEKLSLEEFIPAVGQGSVAIQIHSSLAQEKQDLIGKAINHDETAICLKTERSFLKTLHGGCSIPVFGLATWDNGSIHLKGGIISLDGKRIVKVEKASSPKEAVKMGEELAKELLAKGGKEILQEIKAQQA